MTFNSLVRAVAAYSIATLMMHHAQAADLSIVIDDSAGICGYLDAPLERNAYKRGLQTLLQAKDMTNLDVNVYFLSDLKKPLVLGSTFDKIIQSTAQNCPFTALTSPLHEGVDLKKIKSTSVILVTDMLFDQGSQGSSESRSKFIDAFDQLASSKQKSANDWFSMSAGIIGIKTLFSGNYYNVQNPEKVIFKGQSIERPFYWVWLSSSLKFSPYLNQMTRVWSAPNWGGKKLAIEGIYALKLLPLTTLTTPQKGLFSPPVSGSFQEKSATNAGIGMPTIYYGKNSKLLDDVLPIDGSGRYPTPAECFTLTESPLQIKFKAKCARGGSNESALYSAKQSPQNITLAFPLQNAVDGLNRLYEVKTLEGGFTNIAQADYRNSNESQVFKKNNISGANYPNLVLKIKELRGSKSLLLNGSYVKNKKLMLSVSESYAVQAAMIQDILSTAKNYWANDSEPCLAQTAICQKSNQTTYLFDTLISSLTTRLNANQRAVTLLNQQPQAPAVITIEEMGTQ